MGCRTNSRSGVTAVELALLLPLLMFLFVIALDYGRIFYYSQILANSARSGALYASDPYSPLANRYSSIPEAALAEARDLTPQPTITWSRESGADGRSYVVVTASWTFKTLISYPGVPETVALERTVRAQIAPAAPQ